MSRPNGRPEAEVIVNYSDGCAYSKHKLEEAFRAGGFLEKPPAKSPTAYIRDPHAPAVKREDVDLIVHEFEIPKPQAERLLHEHGGDVTKALRALISPPKPAIASTSTKVNGVNGSTEGEEGESPGGNVDGETPPAAS